MINPYSCSAKCSNLSAQCSTDVSLSLTGYSTLTTRDEAHLLYLCSTCSTVLYPTVIIVLFFSGINNTLADFFIWPVGCKSVEHIEQSMINHSLYHIYQPLQPVQHNTGINEQPLNNVQRIAEPENERHIFYEYRNSKAVQLTVCLCSTMFNHHLNRTKSVIARVSSLN